MFFPILQYLNVKNSLYAASLSGEKMDLEELDTSLSKDEGRIATLLNKFKRWFLSHAQYLNFFTILLLASVSLILLVPHLIVQPLYYY